MKIIKTYQNFNLTKISQILIMSVITVALYACGAGSTSSPSTTSPVYAYISDFNGNKILQCSVSSSESSAGQLVNCQNIAQPLTLNAPTGIAINNGQIYINNSGFNEGMQPEQSSYVQCVLSGVSIFSDCYVGAPTGVTNPIGFTINNGYAYIANYFGGPGYTKPGSYTWCSINSQSGNLSTESSNISSCKTESAPSIGMYDNATPEVVTINNNISSGVSVAYVTDQQNAGYAFCSVSSVDGSLGLCSFESLASDSDSITPIGPRQMTIIGNYAYFANSGNTGGGTIQYTSSYTLCSVSQHDGSLHNCSTQQTSTSVSGQLNNPTGIAFYNNRVYITNEAGPPDGAGGYSYTMCSIGKSGFLIRCNNYIPQGIANNTVGNTWLTYIAFSNQ